MVAEDLVPEVEIGECTSPNASIITCRCDEDNVRKGRFVTVTAGENFPPLVHEADSGERIFGVALKTGNNGDYIPVCIFGIVKMYAGIYRVSSLVEGSQNYVSSASSRCMLE